MCEQKVSSDLKNWNKHEKFFQAEIQIHLIWFFFFLSIICSFNRWWMDLWQLLNPSEALFMSLWLSHVWYDPSHTSRTLPRTPDPKFLSMCFPFSPEECVWNQEHHFHPVSSQLDSVWTGRHVPVQERVCSPAGAQVRRDRRGGLVPAGGSASAEEVLTKCRSYDARKHQTGFSSSVVRTSILIAVISGARLPLALCSRSNFLLNGEI